MLNFKTLYFPPVQLDIADVLTTVGVTVAIGTAGSETVIKWAHDVGDFGGEPSGLDCTPLSSLVHMEKSGVVEQEQWEVDYFYNDDDYDTLEGFKSAATSQNIVVTMNNGTKFTNTGVVTANYLTGLSVNGMTEAKAVINLGNAQGWVKSSQ